MSSLRVRNLIKRFSVNETESNIKLEAANQPNNKYTKPNTHTATNDPSMDTSDSDLDLERKIELLAQDKRREMLTSTTNNNENIYGNNTAQHHVLPRSDSDLMHGESNSALKSDSESDNRPTDGKYKTP